MRLSFVSFFFFLSFFLSLIICLFDCFYFISFFFFDIQSKRTKNKSRERERRLTCFSMKYIEISISSSIRRKINIIEIKIIHIGNYRLLINIRIIQIFNLLNIGGNRTLRSVDHMFITWYFFDWLISRIDYLVRLFEENKIVFF